MYMYICKSPKLGRHRESVHHCSENVILAVLLVVWVFFLVFQCAVGKPSATCKWPICTYMYNVSTGLCHCRNPALQSEMPPEKWKQRPFWPLHFTRLQALHRRACTCSLWKVSPGLEIVTNTITNATNVFILDNQKFWLVAIMATFKTFKPCLKSPYNALHTLDHWLCHVNALKFYVALWKVL